MKWIKEGVLYALAFGIVVAIAIGLTYSVVWVATKAIQAAGGICP